MYSIHRILTRVLVRIDHAAVSSERTLKSASNITLYPVVNITGPGQYIILQSDPKTLRL